MSVSASQAARHLSQRLARRSSEDEAAEAAAMTLLPMLVLRLKEAGATRVVLFGSLANGLFRVDSDIDLAVAGLTERALARLERELTALAHRCVELANLDMMPRVLYERIDHTGHVLQ